MSEIRVETGDLRNGSQAFKDTAAEVGQIENQLSSIPGSVGSIYEGQLARALEAIAHCAAPVGMNLQSRATDLGIELQTRATGFESANETGRSAVLGASTAYIGFIEANPSIGILAWLRQLKTKALSIWSIGGFTVGGLLAKIFVSSPPTIETPFPVIETTSATTEKKKSGLGELLEKFEQEQQEQQNEIKDASNIETWWLPVPLQSQQGLKWSGKGTQYACAPTSTSMILDYWHTVNSENATMSAQKLLDQNAEQGKFTSTGMSATNVHDEVTNLGYSEVEDRSDSNLTELKDAVAKGPVIAIVKLGMKTTGTNHAVVVTGISANNEVRINDPWDGQSHTYSWDEFSKSWGANFGKDVSKNNFVIIRP